MLMINFPLVLMAVLLVSLPLAGAVPTVKRQTGLFTMTIRSLHGHGSQSVHPQVHLQQQINRGERRLARMTGRAVSSDGEMRARLNKRMYIIGNGSAPAGDQGKKKAPIKRYNPASTLFNNFRDKVAKLKGSYQKNMSAISALAASQGNGLDIQAATSPDLTMANPPTGNGSIGLSIDGADIGYVAQVQLGTPPRNFQVLMDSGSADFWVGSENCLSQAGGGCGSHQFLGSQSSSTFVDTKAPFSVTYGTGAVSGTIIQDNVIMAGLQLNGHTFGAANLESSDFSADTTPFDGLLGLAQSGLSQQGKPSPVESLAAAGLISAPITSYKISRLADRKNDGEITFGGLDTNKFDQATLVTLPNVNTRGFWEANLDAVTVDGQDAGLQGRSAILDTGTTLLLAPGEDAAAVHQLIHGAKPDGLGGFTVPCTMNQSVALSFGGKSFSIDPRDIALLPVDPANPTGDCSSGISSGHVVGANEWLVGDVFLKNAYFSTDIARNTLSLAQFL